MVRLPVDASMGTELKILRAKNKTSASTKAFKSQTNHQWVESLAVDSLALRHSHGAERSTMVAALHGDYILLSRDRPGHLDGRLNGFRARVPKEERVKRRVGHYRKQSFNKLQVWLVECEAALMSYVSNELKEMKEHRTWA